MAVAPQTAGSAVAANGLRRLIAVVPALVTAAVMLAPTVMLAWNGLSPVGMTEESTGYRYFYSLRTLYTPDERPWLPQGQVMTVLHLVLQALLTLAGYPVGQLTPRMELFAFLGAGAAAVGTAVAAFWALRPLRSVAAQLLVVTVFACVIFDYANSYGAHLLAPDYLGWVHAVMMLALGCTLRLAPHRDVPSWRWIVGVGVVAGLAISLKVTLAVFALPAALLVLARAGTVRRAAVAALVIGGIAGALFVGITCLSYAGSVKAMALSFWLLASFAGSIESASQASFLSWYTARLLGDASWPVRLSAVVPLVIAASAALLRPRLVSLVLLPALALSIRLLWKRDEPTTFVEVFDLVLMALVVWVSCVAVPAVSRAMSRARLIARVQPVRGPLLLAVDVLALVGCLWVLVPVVSIALQAHRESITPTNRLQEALDRYFVEHPGKIAILTLDNEHRPVTRDSAIFKGGTDVSISDLWGASPFVAGLVPDRHYFFPTPALRTPVDLSSFTSLHFVSRESVERLDVMQGKLAKAFGVSLIGFDCSFHPTLFSSQYYVCARLPDAPIAQYRGEIAYVPSMLALEAGEPAFWRQSSRRPLQAGEAAFVGSSGEVWRMEASGTFTRLGGEPGQTVQISALGNWSRSREAGVTAVFGDSHWRITESPSRPINRNPTLRVQPDGSIRGWDLLSREQVTLERGDESVVDAAPDGWLGIQVRAAGSRVGVRAGLDRDELAGGPALAILTVRAVSQGSLSVRMGAAAPGNTVSVESSDAEAREIPARGTWERIVVKLEQAQLVGDRLALLVELTNPQPGDRLDIAKAEIFAARYP